MPLIEAGGPCVFLQGPERMCAHVFHCIFQQLGTQALSLQDRLYEELFDRSILHKNKSLHDAIVPDPDILQRIGIPLCYIGNLQLPKIEFVIEEDGVKLQPIVENLDCKRQEKVGQCLKKTRPPALEKNQATGPKNAEKK